MSAWFLDSELLTCFKKDANTHELTLSTNSINVYDCSKDS